ncbi:MAG: transcriptional regulator, LysR family, partial [Clostridiales bacterium]|nr:transcriptional regulator, LysR family [Clostridiales bacterium]
MDLHYLKLFNTLAKELNFSKAADALFISQPAVSMQIKKLENDLNLKLFDKIGKSIFLNDNGKVLYDYTKKIFSLVEEAETKLSIINGEFRGNINIGASNTPGTYILPKVLGRFKEKYPSVNTTLHVANTYRIEKMIFENKIDFAINGGDTAYKSQIYVERMAEDKLLMVASPESKYITASEVEMQSLTNAKFIMHEKNSQLYKLTEEIVGKHGLPLNITMCLGSIDAIKQAVASDLGISIIPKSAIDAEIKYEILKEIHLKGFRWKYPYNLIYHKNKNLSPASEK